MRRKRPNSWRRWIRLHVCKRGKALQVAAAALGCFLIVALVLSVLIPANRDSLSFGTSDGADGLIKKAIRDQKTVNGNDGRRLGELSMERKRAAHLGAVSMVLLDSVSADAKQSEEHTVAFLSETESVNDVQATLKEWMSARPATDVDLLLAVTSRCSYGHKFPSERLISLFASFIDGMCPPPLPVSGASTGAGSLQQSVQPCVMR